jgi:uncharacterized protein YjeT (DUF2065 family)
LGTVLVVEGLVGHGSWSHWRGWLRCIKTLAAAQLSLSAWMNFGLACGLRRRQVPWTEVFG